MTDNSLAVTNYKRIQSALKAPEIKTRFSEIVGNSQAGAYLASVLVAVSNSDKLQQCSPVSIIGSAIRSASLRLSCDPSTGHAYLVPFKDKCTLIVGYKGLMQMALRSGKYRFINVATIFEGQTVEEDQMTGVHKIIGGRTGDKRIGHILFFELVTGYQKTFYMTVEEIHAHAARFSKTYKFEDSFWVKDTLNMEKKTVLRLGLTRWGYFDPHDATLLEQSEEVTEENESAVDLARQMAAETPEVTHTEEQNLSDMGF
jgi:recombination protein RecT